MHTIAFTKVALPFGWLGNMAPYPIDAVGRRWRTTEALFQALRFPEESLVRELIRETRSPMAAKMVAKSHRPEMVVEPMGGEDVADMEACLRLKLASYPELAGELAATDDALIVEDCSSRPRGSGLFWGAARRGDRWEGENVLGKLWMKLREEARN